MIVWDIQRIIRKLLQHEFLRILQHEVMMCSSINVTGFSKQDCYRLTSWLLEIFSDFKTDFLLLKFLSFFAFQRIPLELRSKLFEKYNAKVWVGATSTNSSTSQIITFHGHTPKFYSRGNFSLVGL